MKILLALVFAALAGSAALSAQPVSSGIDDIDRLAREVASSPTTAANQRERHAMLSSWYRLLMHQGFDMSEFERVLEVMRGDSGSSAPFEAIVSQRQRAAAPAMLAGIDEGFRVLAQIQANPKKHSLKVAPADPAANAGAPGSATDWGLFHGGHGQNGYTDDPGPSQGKLAWRFPVGHAWYARPAIENGRVYVASPGLVTIAYCLDEKTGAVVWKAKQYGLNLYREPRASSSAVVLKDAVVVRESGSGGEQRNAVDLVYIDKQSGKILKEVRAGHVDYRRGYAPVVGDSEGRYLAHPRGYMAIQNRPPLVWMLNTVSIEEADTGKQLWELRVGDIFGDPVIAGDGVYAATAEGVLYSLAIKGQSRVRWTFDAGAGLLGTPEVAGDSVFIGANDSRVHAVDRATGARRWSFKGSTPDGHAFQFFSTPRAADGRLYVGAADKHLYCLDAPSGTLVWKVALSDWVRSRPIVVGDTVFVATMDGRVHAFSHGDSNPEKRWETVATTHQILADLVGTPAGILATSNDLYVTSLDPRTGRVQWRQSLLEAATVGGERVSADVVAGGADYQSPPAAVGGLVYVGSPNRFVYAVEAATGKEVWRFETSGQVSAQPIVADGRVFFGQQGGDKNYYCVDAKTGAPVWKKPLGWAWVSASYRDGNIYFGTVEGYIHCVRGADGALVWTHATNGGVYPAPATDEENVYTGSWDGHYYALDRATGVPRWAYHLGGHPDSAAPMLWKGKLVIQALSKYLDAIDVRTGQSAWKFNVPPGFDINATPAAHEDRVFFSIFRVVNHTPSGARLFAIHDSSGKPLWEFRPGGGLTGPSIARDRVYFASTADVFFTCVDAKGNGDGTTNLIWRYKMGGVVEESCPAIYGRRAFVLCSDRYLYAFE